MLESKSIPYSETIGTKDKAIEVERGYIGFVTIITFDLDGCFKDIGAFE
jgi:hypothetical protein